MTNQQRAREFLFEWLGVDHRNDCRGSSIDPETGMCDACRRRVQPPAKMVAALVGVLDAVTNERRDLGWAARRGRLGEPPPAKQSDDEAPSLADMQAHGGGFGGSD